MRKQDKIQEAYGEYWDKLHHTNKIQGFENDGWCDFYNFCFNYNIVDHKPLLKTFDINIEDCLIRPKSLQGIENNNGWIKIESESDLPKTRGIEDIFILDKENRISVGSTMLLSSKETRIYWKSNLTHYQPIVKPQPPIY